MGALQDVKAFAATFHAAAGAVHEGHDAVDLRVIIENAGAVDGFGDEFGDGSRAVHRGQDADIVAGADAAIGAAIALEGGALRLGQEVDGDSALGKGIVVYQRAVGPAHAAIVLVHPIAGRDRFLGKADDLAELDHRVSRRNRPGGEFVPARNAADDADALSGLGADIEIGQSHRDIVGGVEHERLALRADQGVGHGGVLSPGAWGNTDRRFTWSGFARRLRAVTTLRHCQALRP